VCAARVLPSYFKVSPLIKNSSLIFDVPAYFFSVCLSFLSVRDALCSCLFPTTNKVQSPFFTIEKKRSLFSLFFCFGSERRVTTANCLLEEKKEKKDYAYLKNNRHNATARAL